MSASQSGSAANPALATWYASASSDGSRVSGSGFKAVSVLRSAGAGAALVQAIDNSADAETPGPFLLDLAEDVLLMILRFAGSPLQPRAAVSLASCCKAMRSMPLLKLATKALRIQHQAVVALTTKVGLTLERLANASRLSWVTKGLTHKDAKVLAFVVRLLPRLSELDLRFNEIGDEGLMELASASAKGWLPELTALNLSSNGITTRGAEALASAIAGSPPAFAQLESLSLSHNAVLTDGMASLALAMGDGALPKLLTFCLDGNTTAAGMRCTDDAVVQQALAQPSAARLVAARRAGGNAWNYLGGSMCNSLAENGFGCSGSAGFGRQFGNAWLRQSVYRGYW